MSLICTQQVIWTYRIVRMLTSTSSAVISVLVREELSLPVPTNDSFDYTFNHHDQIE